MDYRAVYQSAATVLRTVAQRTGTLRSALARVTTTHRDPRDIPIIFALAVETLKYYAALQYIARNVEIPDTRGLDRFLLLVLLYETIIGAGSPKCAPYRSIMQRNKARLQSQLTLLKVRTKARTNLDLIPAHIRNAIRLPRWVRVNTLRKTVDEVVNDLQRTSGKGALSLTRAAKTKSMFERIENAAHARGPEHNSFHVDIHIPQLVALPHGCDLRSWDMYLDGGAIIQDKASCFPSYLLNPREGSVVLDACAAPGNKTSHLSAIMRNTGKILALDLDMRRLDTLKKMCSKAGCTNIEAINTNFLEVDPLAEPFCNVEYILLDPSCSGSGIVGRLDHLTDTIQVDSENDEQDEFDRDEIATLFDDEVRFDNKSKSNVGNGVHPYENKRKSRKAIEKEKNEAKAKQIKKEQKLKAREARLESLAQFQENAIKHAMSFPKLKRMTYSTCSKWERENEQVISNVLDFAKERGFVLEENPFPQWKTRGLDSYKFAKSVIRANPSTDLTIGFFVAVFVRE